MDSKRASAEPDDIAPDGSEVRVLLANGAASTATFTLAAGATSAAARHRTVSEIWFVLAGQGELWRSLDGTSVVTPLSAGVSVDIPLGASFQFRAFSPGPLRILGTTTPPWPGASEAELVDGPW